MLQFVTMIIFLNWLEKSALLLVLLNLYTKSPILVPIGPDPTLNLETNSKVGDKILKTFFEVYDTDSSAIKILLRA